MNQEIHWGKIAALVVAIAGIASIAFVAGRKATVQNGSEPLVSQETKSKTSEPHKKETFFGPYDNVFAVTENKEGSIVGYAEGEKYFVRTPKGLYGPYDYDVANSDYFHISDRHLFPLGSDGWIFSYEKDREFFLNINGKDLGPYDRYMPGFSQESFHIRLSVSGDHYLFSYRNGNQFFTQVDGKEYGPYERIDSIFGISNSGAWMLEADESKKHYMVISGEKFGPYDRGGDDYKIDDGVIFESRALYRYDKNGQQYISVDGKVFGPYDQAQEEYFYSALDAQHFVAYFRRNGKEFVLADGVEYGPYSMNFGYNEVQVAGNHWSAEIDDKQVLLDGTLLPRFSDFKEAQIADFKLSEDGSWDAVIVDSSNRNRPAVTRSSRNKIVEGPVYEIMSFVNASLFSYDAPDGETSFVRAYGKTFGPMYEIGTHGLQSARVFSSGDIWAFAYGKKKWAEDQQGGIFVNVLGKERGPYQDVYLDDAGDDAGASGVYLLYKKEGRWFAEILSSER